MNHHSFLLKEAMGRVPLWKLNELLGITKSKALKLPEHISEGSKLALQRSPSSFKPPSLSQAGPPKIITKNAHYFLTKEALRTMGRSALRTMPKAPDIAAAIPQATEAVSTARNLMQTMTSANVSPQFLGSMTPQQRDQYVKMILGRAKPLAAVGKVKSIIPKLPDEIRNILI